MGSELIPGGGLGIVVGMEAEAKIARTLVAADHVGISGSTSPGAERAIEQLLQKGVTALLSFGIAAGLDPAVKAGAILLPREVQHGERLFAVDRGLHDALSDRLADLAPNPGRILHSNVLIADPVSKQRLFRDTLCTALDMESGHVALRAMERKIGFAVLRVVCDDAARSLPPAACIPLRENGRIRTRAVAASVVRQPGQIGELLRVGRDAVIGQRMLVKSTRLLAGKRSAPL